MRTNHPYELPAAACDSLADPAIKLELHGISFSHYVERTRWTLRLLGIPYKEVSYLPLLHMPAIIRLQRRFKQGPGRPTESSKSPAATPCLAIYTASGQPLCLLQDSALICRYAMLRAAALQLPYAAPLYGTPPLTLAPRGDGGDQAGVGSRQLSGGDGSVHELEARLGGTLGIEVRRLAYYHLLPLPSAGGTLFINNSGGKTWLARIVYYLCRLLLPRLLVINAATAARGQQRLLAEFDYLDSLLQQQQQGAKAAAATAAAAGSDAVEGTPEPPRLPYYLFGSTMSIADIQLACLAAPLLCIPNELSTIWMPPLTSLPTELRSVIEGLRERPTGKFVLELWRVHGPLAGTAAGTAAPTSKM